MCKECRIMERGFWDETKSLVTGERCDGIGRASGIWKEQVFGLVQSVQSDVMVLAERVGFGKVQCLVWYSRYRAM
jgi:hypothetical protein